MFCREGIHIGVVIAVVNAGEPGVAQQHPNHPINASSIQNRGTGNKAKFDKASNYVFGCFVDMAVD